MGLSNRHAIVLALVLLYNLTTYTSICQASRPISITTNNIHKNYIKKSCNTTLYPQLCYASLVKYADKIQANPKSLANTSIFLTFSASKSISVTIKKIWKSQGLSPREAAAVHDCMEETRDASFELQNSIKEMDHIDPASSNFELEISNIQTWVSAALTGYDTCMDGFGMTEGKVKSEVGKYVKNVSQLTSIALALINNYAASR